MLVMVGDSQISSSMLLFTSISPYSQILKRKTWFKRWKEVILSSTVLIIFTMLVVKEHWAVVGNIFILLNGLKIKDLIRKIKQWLFKICIKNWAKLWRYLKSPWKSQIILFINKNPSIRMELNLHLIKKLSEKLEK